MKVVTAEKRKFLSYLWRLLEGSRNSIKHGRRQLYFAKTTANFPPKTAFQDPYSSLEIKGENKGRRLGREVSLGFVEQLRNHEPQRYSTAVHVYLCLQYTTVRFYN